MTKAQKKNLRIFTILVLILVGSTGYRFMVTPVIQSIDKFACIQDDIKKIEDTAYYTGWTDEQSNTVKELEAQRKKMAEEDPIFAWAYAAHFSTSGSNFRNTIVVVLTLLAGVSYILTGISSTLLVLRLLNHILRFQKVQNVFGNVAVPYSKFKGHFASTLRNVKKGIYDLETKLFDMWDIS